MGAAFGFALRLVLGTSLAEAAVVADRAAGLKERLSTALEVLEGHAAGAGEDGPLAEALLAQAREAGARLDAGRLRFPNVVGRRSRAVLVAVVVLAAAAFIPSVAGPPIPPEAASKARRAVEPVAGGERLAETIRRELGRALAVLREAGARQGDADRATASVFRAAAADAAARQAVTEALVQARDADLRRLAQAAAVGDRSGAAGAGRSLAARLGKSPEAGGLPMGERERLADSLEAAASAAAGCDLGEVAGPLAEAARVVRESPVEAGAAIDRLAAALAQALDPSAARGVAAAMAAMRDARRAIGLPDLPEGFSAGPVPDRSGPVASVEPDGLPGDGGPAASVSPEEGTGSPEIRAEDRGAVERYFGG